MLISLCTAVMNRLDDLRLTMPARIRAANESPPVRIGIYDYSSTDGLSEYMDELMEIAQLAPGNSIAYAYTSGKKYMHITKAWNAAIISFQSEYFIKVDADTIIMPGYINAVREQIEEGAIWGNGEKYLNSLFCKLDYFIKIGGYDERFEFYGPDDKDFLRRLALNGGKRGELPRGLLEQIYTPDDKKVINYRVKGTKHSLSRQMRHIYEENMRNEVMVANVGEDWGNG